MTAKISFRRGFMDEDAKVDVGSETRMGWTVALELFVVTVDNDIVGSAAVDGAGRGIGRGWREILLEIKIFLEDGE
jgi:hypothetical protein